MDFDDETTEAHERRITRCRSCRERIVFLRTNSGKQMPVDADTVDPDDTKFDPERHESHFAKCPAATDYRKERR